MPVLSRGAARLTVLFCSSFGHKILTLKPLVKLIPVIMEHKDKSVREEAKGLIVELHRWIGAAIKAQLTSLKPVQVSLLFYRPYP